MSRTFGLVILLVFLPFFYVSQLPGASIQAIGGGGGAGGVGPSGPPGPSGPAGPSGPPGTAGTSALSATTGTFLIPALNSSVSVVVSNGAPFQNLSGAIITDGTHSIFGYITAGGTTTTLTFQNQGLLAGAVGNTMASGAFVIPGPIPYNGGLGAAGTLFQVNAGATLGAFVNPTFITFTAGSTPTISGQVEYVSNDFQYFDATAARTFLTNQFKPVVQVFTSSGTYTPTANTVYTIIEAVGGGGGSGGIAGSASAISLSGGGGSGGYSMKTILSPTTQSVVIGTSGSAGTSGANVGGSGGNTTFATSVLIANGGGGSTGLTAGSTAPTGGAAAAAGTGDVTLPGSPGSNGINAVIAGTTIFGAPNGAQSHFGGGGRGACVTSGTAVGGASAANTGGGGGGSAVDESLTSITGAAGGSGILIATDYVRK